MLMSFDGSYCPVGALTTRLAPISVRGRNGAADDQVTEPGSIRTRRLTEVEAFEMADDIRHDHTDVGRTAGDFQRPGVIQRRASNLAAAILDRNRRSKGEVAAVVRRGNLNQIDAVRRRRVCRRQQLLSTGTWNRHHEGDADADRQTPPIAIRNTRCEIRETTSPTHPVMAVNCPGGGAGIPNS